MTPLVDGYVVKVAGLA